MSGNDVEDFIASTVKVIVNLSRRESELRQQVSNLEEDVRQLEAAIMFYQEIERRTRPVFSADRTALLSNAGASSSTARRPA